MRTDKEIIKDFDSLVDRVLESGDLVRIERMFAFMTDSIMERIAERIAIMKEKPALFDKGEPEAEEYR